MAIQKTEAFILRTQLFRSSSLLVTAFSRSFGKIKGVAKGVRGEGVLRSADFEPFHLVEIVFYEKIHSELHLISEVATLKTHESLHSNLEILAYAHYFSELIDQLTETHDRHESIFELLGFALEGLPLMTPSQLTSFFEIRLLREVGFLPYLDHCLECEEKELRRVYFSTRQGAIFCERCRTKAPEARMLSLDALRAMQRFLTKEAGEALVEPLPQKVNREMSDLVERFLIERLGKRLKTRRFLKQVNALIRQPI